jgi:hypothetical protein
MSEGLASGHVAVSPVSPPEPSALELEDILYDIVASGADPNLPAGTLEAVTAFLHQHARTKHSLAEFKAFFVEHKLSMVKDTGFGLALPPMMELRAASRAIERAPERTLAPVALPEPEPIEVAPVAVAEAARQSRVAIWASAAAVLAALSGGAFWAAASARAELEQVRAEQRAAMQALERVEAEAASLRENLDRNAELARSIDHKTDLLLQSLVSPLDRARH